MISTLDKIKLDISIHGAESNMNASLKEVFSENGISVYDFEVNSKAPLYPSPITLKWKIPGIDVKGVWKPTTDFNKRIQADWELEHMESRISIDAPVIGLFGNEDSNIMTFSCSNPINTLEMNARLREEDNHFYCHLTFFSEQEQEIEHFKAQLRIDFRNNHFSDCLRDVSKWWETFEALKPTPVPEIAKKPIYSTWYQFHQSLEEKVLVAECAVAKEMGYEAIIIDDGWQTNDSNRGYDYTGDWQPERFPNMAGLIKNVQATGMKAAIWYSVPFCGKKSKAYQKFKGKFLTEEHRWAPVFDPRYPEVREHLIGLYTNALKEWNLDGFKLDFIDDFHIYESTPLGKENGRDYASINEAVDRLLTDVITQLKAIKSDVFIEFRQKYTGPAMRKYGNMFRAFDCPGDAVMNRIRIADIRMLCGNTAAHADMITWHREETVEVAALQLINILFGVPQLSIMLRDVPASHLEMVKFYTEYWNENADTLMNGYFIPSKPLANYPTQRVSKDGKTIIGVYEELVIALENDDNPIHIHNGQMANEVVLRNKKDFGTYKCEVYDCRGEFVSDSNLEFVKGLIEIAIPPCGILIAKKI
ncbi:alpha-galactosidase [Maribacter algarum]|uniref:Alpha-galactosidase n=1 Tax=Maribacter algarum (ex Zhang et al. 2020) TaxID=2578118 RepID=A0A5S3PU13_9FLAO|nr:glycoside hydrolase family 36 protein [Maribacter algarum]TMM58499.1 alpha-galactosidase [Maribacter algarum]